MKKLLLIMAVTACIASCSPAAETQVHMEAQAKRTSDSIAHFIDSALNDPIKELSGSLAASSYTPVIQP